MINKEIKKYLKLMRPGLTGPICNTLACLGPPLHLLLSISDGDTSKLRVTSIMSIFTISLMFVIWYFYAKQNKWYRKYKGRLKTLFYYEITGEPSIYTDAIKAMRDLSFKEREDRIQQLLDLMEM